MIRKSYKKIKDEKKNRDYRRKLSIRKKISGSSEVPRICAIKTNKHLQIQVIDDSQSKTLFTVQTFGKNKVADKCNAESAKAVGKAVGEKMKELKLETGVYDRNGKLYSGVMKTLADSIREQGIRI